MSNVNIPELEFAICQLKAVNAARIVVDEESGEIDKVHVMAAPDRSPKKIVRDIETLFVLRFNQPVDYRKISLVHGTMEEFQAFMRPRLRLLTVEERALPGGRRVMASLADEKGNYIGVADGGPDTDRLLLAARATADALSSVVPETSVEGVVIRRVKLAKEEVLLTALTLVNEEGRQNLVGTAHLQGEELAAAARATLDAVNRRLFNT